MSCLLSGQLAQVTEAPVPRRPELTLQDGPVFTRPRSGTERGIIENTNVNACQDGCTSDMLTCTGGHPQF